MDAARLEKRTHGTASFPFQIYPVHDTLDGDVIPYHWHPELEIIQVISGEVGLTIADEHYTGRAGDLFFVSAGQLHEIRGGLGNQFRAAVFPLDFLQFRRPDRAQSELLAPLEDGRLRFTTVLRAGESGSDALRAAFAQMTAVCEQKPVGYELLVKACLLTLVSQAAAHGLLTACTVSDAADYQTQLLRDIVVYLGEHCAEPLRLPEVSARFGLSPQYFCSFFKAHLGRTFVQHLNFLRIERASRLLRETDAPIMEIGFQVGFENFSYFIKRFREVFGCTPSSYRKNGQSAP